MAYHHGNLRHALVRAGLEILDELGLDALTLRGCASRAGVSHAAPKNHFANLDALVAAIVAEGFRRMRDSMRQAMAAADSGPRAQLVAAAEGYLAFAEENQALFRLAFSIRRGDSDSQELRAAGDESYAVLSEVCAPLVPRINGMPVTRAAVEIMVWSYVHGYASLAVNTRFRRAEQAIGRIPGIAEAMPPFEIADDAPPVPPENRPDGHRAD
ncbi:MAG: TetR/AcrR family transcriptional regulator [Thalassobaculaceae bacterium]|nr:TetR/AcrR family transcriptional regulator [Thalassobaculaceae bacterium]